MQRTFHCNGELLPDFPNDIAVADVHVYMHDSLMLSTHDYSCPCCRKNHAVLDGSTGLMQPCWECQDKGYKLVKREPKQKNAFLAMIDRAWNWYHG